jgi:tetratricopeptide (TPR) repeat protein
MARLSIDKGLLKAKYYAEKGETLAAKALVMFILDASPKNRKALNLLSALQGEQDNSLSHNPSSEIMEKLIALYNEGHFHEVVNGALELSKLHPNSVTVWNLLGAANQAFGKYEEAIRAFRRVIQLDSNYAPGFNNLGASLLGIERFDDAEEAIDKALKLKSDYSEAYVNLAAILQARGKFDEVIKVCNKVLQITPNHPKAHNTLGNALQAQGKIGEAIEAYEKSLRSEPSASKFNNIGMLFQQQGKIDDAIKAYKEAILLKPDSSEAHNNLGKIFLIKRDLSGAEKEFKLAIAISPKSYQPRYNLGVTLFERLNFERAIEAFSQSIDCNPNFFEAYYSLGQTYLMIKDFSKGFKLCESRWETKQHLGTALNSEKPQWNGEKDQRVLVWNEQGIGDELMCASIISDAVAICDKLSILCDERLLPILKRSFNDRVDFIPRNPLKRSFDFDFDFQSSILSLPTIFRPSLDSFKNSSSGYLKADEKKVKEFREIVSKGEKKRVYGLSWNTKSSIKNSQKRNISLYELSKNFNLPDVQLVSLQYGEISNDVKNLKNKYGIYMMEMTEVDIYNDLDELAALIVACDKVITIDNFIVHFAGSLGVSTELLLPSNSDWRWSVEDKSSYWYENVNIHRQTKEGDWSEVLAGLCLN